MNYIKVTYGIGNSFIKSTFEDNSTYVKTSVNSTFIKVAYDGGDAGLDAERLRTKVYNVTGGTLAKGTVVYINGSHGNLPSVAKAIATSDATSAQTFGLVLDDIVDNKSGYIILAGKLSDLDTQAIAAGSQLYLSSTVAGAYTTTKQYAPAHLVYIGVVNRSHPTQGEIEVRIANGYEADELHDFAVRNPSNNDGIFFNSATSLWEKKQISTALGYTPVPTSRTITINGVSYDLSADRSYTIAAGISGSGASGQVAFWNGASSLTGVNGLFWDNTNGRLGIGTNTPEVGKFLDIVYNVPTNGGAGFRVRNTSSSGYSELVFDNDTTPNGSGAFVFGYSGTSSATGASVAYFWQRRNSPMLFGTNNVERIRVFGGGNVAIGSSADDGINRLQVSGKAKVTGDMTISGMTVGIGSGNVGTNVVIGPSTFISNTSGQHNIAIGYASLYSNTVGNQNVSIGLSSMVSNSSGDNNVAIGMSSLQSNLNGYNNTAIGYSAGYSTIANSNTVGANNIFIGFESIGESSLESNRTWIGNTATTSTWVGGNLLVGTRTNNGTDKLQVVGNTRISGALTTSTTFVAGNACASFYDGVYTFNFGFHTSGFGSNRLSIYRNSSNTFFENSSGYFSFNSDTYISGVNGSGITSTTSSTPLTLTASGSTTVALEMISSGLRRFRILANNATTTFESSNQTTGFMILSNMTLGAGSSSVNFINGFNNQIIANRFHLYSTPTNIRGINGGNQGWILSKSTGLSDLYPSSIFAIDSTNQGFLPPRMTTTQKNAIATPTAGLVVYDTTLNKLCVYTTTWETITST